MTQGERVKEVRKKIGLTMEKFGERLGVTKTAISLMESGKNNVTDANIRSICREFSVDYIWLTTGNGEMFVENDDDVVEMIDRIMVGENEFHKNLFKTFARLDESELLALESIMKKVMDLMSESEKEKD